MKGGLKFLFYFFVPFFCYYFFFFMCFCLFFFLILRFCFLPLNVFRGNSGEKLGNWKAILCCHFLRPILELFRFSKENLAKKMARRSSSGDRLSLNNYPSLGLRLLENARLFFASPSLLSDLNLP